MLTSCNFVVSFLFIIMTLWHNNFIVHICAIFTTSIDSIIRCESNPSHSFIFEVQREIHHQSPLFMEWNHQFDYTQMWHSLRYKCGEPGTSSLRDFTFTFPKKLSTFFRFSNVKNASYISKNKSHSKRYRTNSKNFIIALLLKQFNIPIDLPFITKNWIIPNRFSCLSA